MCNDIQLMKPNLLIFYLILLLCVIVCKKEIYAQVCLPDGHYQANDYLVYCGESIPCETEVVFPISFVLVYKSDCTGNISTATANQWIEELNTWWEINSINFRYEITRFEIVCDDQYYYVPEDFDKMEEIRDRYTDYPYAVPLIQTGDVGAGGWGALDWLAIGDYPGGPDFWFHELGHFFGLFHTNDTQRGEQRADGAFCSTTGDLVCDTPPTPEGDCELINLNTCTYDAQIRDSRGVLYEDVLVNNIMSCPAADICGASNITQGQAARMYFHYIEYFKADFDRTLPVDCAIAAPTDGYCDVRGNTNQEYIQQVRLANVDNLSGNNNGYWNFTHFEVDLVASGAYFVTLTPGFNTGNYTEYWRVWIDYNQDGDFNDIGEMIGQKSGNERVRIGFQIPYTISSRTCRMRVAMNFGDYPTSCTSPNYGEVEDYTLKIINHSERCEDGIQNGNETGVDCGGSCGYCEP